MADHFAGPRRRQRMCKHWVEAGDLAVCWLVLAIATRFSSDGNYYPIVVIQEAGSTGLDHRALVQEGSRATWLTRPRSRFASSLTRQDDKIDGEGLRGRAGVKRGEPRVCSMVRVPMPEDEDRRRICRERQTLIAERIRCQSDQRSAVSQGIGDTSRCGGIDAERWRRFARAADGAGREHEGANRTRAGSARIAARPDRGDRGRTRRDVGEAGRGRDGPERPGRPRPCRSRWT